MIDIDSGVNDKLPKDAEAVELNFLGSYFGEIYRLKETRSMVPDKIIGAWEKDLKPSR